MQIKFYHSILYIILLMLFLSCTKIPSTFPVRYYKNNEKAIKQMEASYSYINKAKPFAAEFSDNDFNYVVIDMKTDSIRYLYEFTLQEERLKDTLKKYGYDTSRVMSLLKQMKKIKCTWINTLEYYVDRQKNSMMFMSIRPTALDIPFSRKKYYILTFYKQPQYYDSEGRLLDKKNRNRLRKVSNEIFWRINDYTCYTISDNFR